ncbi:60S ribosomal protein L17, partial [Galemys pyrenaicus]
FKNTCGTTQATQGINIQEVAKCLKTSLCQSNAGHAPVHVEVAGVPGHTVGLHAGCKMQRNSELKGIAFDSLVIKNIQVNRVPIMGHRLYRAH